MAYEKKKDDSAQKKLREQLKNGQLERLYVFYGEESYLKEFYRGEIEKLVSGGGFGDFNIISIDSADLTENNLRDAIETLPFGGERKLIVIRDLDISACPQALKEALPDIFAGLPDYVCLILYYQAIEYKPDKRLNIYKSIDKYGLAVEFGRAGEEELIRWLARRFAAFDKKIGKEECRRIIFLCGSLMTNLITEVDKIAAYSKGEVITREDIDAVASRVLEADVFDLTDCIMKRDYTKAIYIFRDLMEAKNEPIAVLSALTRQVQRIYAAALARREGKGERYLMELYNFRSSYPAELLLNAARNITVDGAAKALEICCNADKEVKSNIPDSERVVELAILKMTRVDER